jgi:hypothetical protein
VALIVAVAIAVGVMVATRGQVIPFARTRGDRPRDR